MAITMTSREFNQHASRALALSQQEPVFITKWGRVVSVMESFQDYQQKQEDHTSKTFEQLFGKATTEDVVSDEFLDDFDEILKEIRRDSHLRPVDLED